MYFINPSDTLLLLFIFIFSLTYIHKDARRWKSEIVELFMARFGLNLVKEVKEVKEV